MRKVLTWWSSLGYLDLLYLQGSTQGRRLPLSHGAGGHGMISYGAGYASTHHRSFLHRTGSLGASEVAGERKACAHACVRVRKILFHMV